MTSDAWRTWAHRLAHALRLNAHKPVTWWAAPKDAVRCWLLDDEGRTLWTGRQCLGCPRLDDVREITRRG